MSQPALSGLVVGTLTRCPGGKSAPLRLVCQCRLLSTTRALNSGHNRWSKIKHEKAKVDAGQSKVRSFLSKEISEAVRANGPDPSLNQRLSALLAEAKKADFPKALMEKAMMRGQGISVTGAPLESISIEFIFPPSMGGIIEAETDNRRRTMAHIKEALKEHGATLSPSQFMFERRGRLLWDQADGRTEETILEHAIEAGALDVEVVEEEEERPEIVVWTETSEMAAVADMLAGSLGTPAKSQQLVWWAKEDSRTEFQNEEFDTMLARLEDLPEVQEVYLNLK